MDHCYSEIRLHTIERFRMARYVIISPNPESDVIAYMEKWAKDSGLLDFPGYIPRRIGWDFPFVTEEQGKVFGLRGYVAAFIIPEEFEPSCCGAELTYQEADNYAVITITDPFSSPFEKIPGAYQKLFTYIELQQFETASCDNRICFEEIYEKDGVTYMDVHVPAETYKR